ncbi:MAG: periplasmic heavy metal sensor [Candidatus Eisenbacteria bacterium]
MKGKLLILVVVILAVVGLSMLTTMVYMRWAGPQRAHFPRRPAYPHQVLRRELGLNDIQIAEIRAQWDSFERQTESTRTQLNEKRRLLMEELRANAPDTVGVDRLVDEIGALQTALEKQVIRHMLREQSALTPEQREKFRSMFHRHFEQKEGMPWPGPMDGRGRHSRPFKPMRDDK